MQKLLFHGLDSFRWFSGNPITSLVRRWVHSVLCVHFCPLMKFAITIEIIRYRKTTSSKDLLLMCSLHIIQKQRGNQRKFANNSLFLHMQVYQRAPKTVSKSGIITITPPHSIEFIINSPPTISWLIPAISYWIIYFFMSVTLIWQTTIFRRKENHALLPRKHKRGNSLI